MKFIYALVIFLLMSYSIPAQVLRIGTSENSPFVYKNTSGQLEGFSIELARAVARELKMKPEFIHSEFSEKLENVRLRKVDIAVGGISVTLDRAKKGILFSHPTMNAGLAILVKKEPTRLPVIPIIIMNLFSAEVGKMLIFLFGTLLFWGFWLWVAERGSDVIKDSFREGYQDAVWCVWAIKTTIGFGDVYPKKLLGRTLTIPIFFTGAVLIAIVSAPIHAAFVQRNLGAVFSSINTKEDLRGKKVATKKGTVSVDILKRLGANVLEESTIENAYKLLDEEKAEAVVFDSPVLINYAKKNPSAVITGGLFSEHHYAIAVSPGNVRLLNEINLALLKLREEGTYQQISDRYF